MKWHLNFKTFLNFLQGGLTKIIQMRVFALPEFSEKLRQSL